MLHFHLKHCLLLKAYTAKKSLLSDTAHMANYS
ncbi:Uncharacterised protein [Mycobacterium tuberculosis]|nr:Uncharacterised protein [Mycobacterium tuberculosis]